MKEIINGIEMDVREIVLTDGEFVKVSNSTSFKKISDENGNVTNILVDNEIYYYCEDDAFATLDDDALAMWVSNDTDCEDIAIHHKDDIVFLGNDGFDVPFKVARVKYPNHALEQTACTYDLVCADGETEDNRYDVDERLLYTKEY